MKTKRIMIILLLSLCIMLAGCKSSDYKKAVQMYEGGDFQAAAELFETIEGYKDSTEWVLKCKYSLAKAAIENKEYDTAIEALNELTDYEDSAELLRRAKFGQLHQYITQNGRNESVPGMTAITTTTLVGESNEVIYMFSPDEETIGLCSQYKITSGGIGFNIEMTKFFGMIIKYDSTTATWNGSLDTMLTGMGNYGNTTEIFDGVIDLPNTRIGTGLSVVNSKQTAIGSGTGYQQTTGEATTDGSEYQKSLDDILGVLPSFLADTGCSMTVQDLGFTGM